MIAPKIYRFLARIVDLFVFLCLVSPLALYPKIKDVNIAGIFQISITTISLLYYLFADSLPNGQSLGKRVFGIAVVSTKSNKNCSVSQSFVRNITIHSQFILPFECLAVLLEDDGRRIGDKWARTIVIRRRTR
jgi:uncharacterized RDD family membrane protein YckC